MIDLLICEDRPIVLMGLKKITERLELPIGEIYLAEDGEKALDIFSENDSIGLVMTDIQMPGCDGLQLLRQMQQLRGDFRAIIISGHNDFEYARTAILLGIEDYLLKPVDPKELKAALIRCIESLTSHISQKQILSGILLDQIREVWGDAIDEDASADILAAEAKFFRASSFGVMLFHLDSLPPVSPDEVKKLISGFLSERYEHSLVFTLFGRTFCAVINLSQAEEDHFSSPVEGISEFLDRCEAARLYCGAAPKVTNIFQLNEAIYQAEGALCLRYTQGRSRRGAYIWEPLSPVSLQTRAQIFQQCDGLCQSLRLPDIPAVEKGVDTLFSSFTPSQLLQTLPACLRKIELFITQELLDEDEGGYYDLIRALCVSDSLENLRENIKNGLLSFCRDRLKRRMAKQDAVEQAIEYMEKNYRKPLTLTILANVVSLNYTYFSNIFKARTGVSVIGYLQNLRVQKAKELLVSTDDKVREIAHKTGFSDERYFEKLFKRSEGMTPSEYRDSLRDFSGEANTGK